MQLSAGKQNHAACRTDDVQLRIDLDLLRRARKTTRITLRGVSEIGLTLHAVLVVVVVLFGSILDDPVKVLRVERHAIFTADGINRYPPIQLTLRRGVPGIAMRMPCLSQALSQILIAGRK